MDMQETLYLDVDIMPQPNDLTCGPTSLHAVYRFYGLHVGLEQVIREVHMLEDGGTLAPLLGSHALTQGFQAKIYTYSLQIFDPTWFEPGVNLMQKLNVRLQFTRDEKSRAAIRSYLDFLERGGSVLLEDLTANLIRKYLNRQCPILTGLSATYLYRAKREYGPQDEPDDIRGEPAGHFVVLSGYDDKTREVQVHDPLYENPYSRNHQYRVSLARLICSILLGTLTYDGNLLIIEPKGKPALCPT